MTESANIKSTANWLSAISAIAFLIGVTCAVIGFFMENADGIHAIEIGGVLVTASFSALFWAQLTHIRAGIEKTNETLAILVDRQSVASVPRLENQQAKPAVQIPKVVPVSKEHTEWLLACTRADQQGAPRPTRPFNSGTVKVTKPLPTL